MRLILIRHGQTEGNLNKILEGINNSELTSEGKLATSKVASFLDKFKVDYVFLSPAKRCLDTAREFLKIYQGDLSLVSDLREQNWGALEGVRGGFDIAISDAKKQGLLVEEYRPKNGESILDMRKRVFHFYNLVINTYKDTSKNIVFFTHEGPIVNLLLSLFPEKKFYDFLHKNCAITILSISKDVVNIESLASINHLK